MLYQNAGELAAQAERFAALGASADGAVLVIAGGPTLAMLRARLGRQLPVSWTDMSVLRNPARLPGRIRGFAEEHPGRAVWCVHQPLWRPPSAPELLEMIRHEALLNVALAGLAVRMLCPYDCRLGGRLLDDVARVHPELLREGQRRPSPHYESGCVPTECDEPLSPPPADADQLSFRANLAQVRRFAAASAGRVGLSAGRTADLVTAVAELAANTLVHTSGPGLLRIWVEGGELLAQVEDSGKITDPLAGRLSPLATASGRGRGLWVVEQVCDLAERRVGPAGNAIRLHFSLSPQAPAWSLDLR